MKNGKVKGTIAVLLASIIAREVIIALVFSFALLTAIVSVNAAVPTLSIPLDFDKFTPEEITFDKSGDSWVLTDGEGDIIGIEISGYMESIALLKKRFAVDTSKPLTIEYKIRFDFRDSSSDATVNIFLDPPSEEDWWNDPIGVGHNGEINGDVLNFLHSFGPGDSPYGNWGGKVGVCDDVEGGDLPYRSAPYPKDGEWVTVRVMVIETGFEVVSVGEEGYYRKESCAYDLSGVKYIGVGFCDQMRSKVEVDYIKAIEAKSDYGLVAEWLFDEVSEGIVKDSSGNGNDGMFHGVNWAEGKISKSLYFDGVDDYVEIPHSSELSITDDITVELWIYPNGWSSSWQGLVAKRSGGPYAEFGFNARSDIVFQWYFGTGTGTGTGSVFEVLTTTNFPQVNEWTHVVGVRRGNVMELYFNGDLITSKTFSTTPTSTTASVIIGSSMVEFEAFNGLIDEVRIWNRALSAEEIKEYYESTAMTTPAKIAEYHAPIIYQDVADDDPQADYITKFNYDGDWIGNNNWDNLENYKLLPYVYYSVVESENHWFICYAFNHPRDTQLWHDFDLLKHENDMEGLMMVIEKDGTRYGRLCCMVTVAHYDFFSFVLPNSNIEGNEEDIDGEISFEGSHPRIYIQAKGHGVFGCPGNYYKGLMHIGNWEEEFPIGPWGGYGGIVYCPGDKSEEPSLETLQKENAQRVSYKLRLSLI